MEADAFEKLRKSTTLTSEPEPATEGESRTSDLVSSLAVKDALNSESETAASNSGIAVGDSKLNREANLILNSGRESTTTITSVSEMVTSAGRVLTHNDGVQEVTRNSEVDDMVVASSANAGDELTPSSDVELALVGGSGTEATLFDTRTEDSMEARLKEDDLLLTTLDGTTFSPRNAGGETSTISVPLTESTETSSLVLSEDMILEDPAGGPASSLVITEPEVDTMVDMDDDEDVDLEVNEDVNASSGSEADLKEQLSDGAKPGSGELSETPRDFLGSAEPSEAPTELLEAAEADLKSQLNLEAGRVSQDPENAKVSEVPTDVEAPEVSGIQNEEDVGEFSDVLESMEDRQEEEEEEENLIQETNGIDIPKEAFPKGGWRPLGSRPRF